MCQIVSSTRSLFPILALVPLLSLWGGLSSALELEDIPICHGFGCTYKETTRIDPKDWEQIQAFFIKPAESPEQEREQIRKASGWFEVIMGKYTPIHRDMGQNKVPNQFQSNRLGKDEYINSVDYRGQMDCIDESLNMTTYLDLMEQAGLLKHHKVVERAHRSTARDQHYAGQIEEIQSGTRWVVDSWFFDFGVLPYIEESSEWHDIPFFFSTSFPTAFND